ncbi:hypothetical protein [Streptomyces sp. NPDC101178]|uniref:hypothetical protein n=1 Tax=Streptomyces sp. NPDC101178 TaxID=3366124 RepID=UPI00383006CD
MNPFTVLAVGAARWSSYGSLLGSDATRTLGRQLAALRAGEGDPDTAADRAARTLLDALPPEIAAALREEGDRTRFSGSPPAVHHQGYSVRDLCLVVVDGNPMIGPFLGPVRERLLSEPAAPWHPGLDPLLIVLSGDDGRRQVPLFQFEVGTMPWRVVLDVNAVLGADSDPWGVADWWLAESTWWRRAPASLLGQGRDAELRGAAAELDRED